MKTPGGTMWQILNTGNDGKIIIIRLITGLIFLSEGILKFKLMQWLGPGRFSDIGFENAHFWASFTGSFEIVCGFLILLGLFTRLASVPLLIIMIVAFVTTKLTLLSEKGFWTFAHEYTTDFSLTLLLILLIIYGGGRWSADLRLAKTTAVN
ncbi:MAG: DoxX family protein [Bacteroidales bacterium]|jgi:uncharacterized membrane protein YphA (DoxX/SURF4 family)|nr:DoxX family protein [Bacteroidales bacterium]